MWSGGHVRCRHGNHVECGGMETTQRPGVWGHVEPDRKRSHNVYEVEALVSVG